MIEPIYPEGIICFKKHDKAPDFVIGTMKISLNALVDWAKKHPELLTDYKGDKQLSLNMAFTKSDHRPNVTVDTYGLSKAKADAFDNSVTQSDDLPF